MKYTHFLLHNVTPSIPTLTAETISAETVIADAFKAALCIRARSMSITIVYVLGTFVYICNALWVKHMNYKAVYSVNKK